MTPASLHHRFIIPALFLLVLAAFWPGTRSGYFIYDDDAYFRSNPNVHQPITPHAIYWALTSSHNGYAVPLTTIAWMAEYQVFGDGPAGYHWVNILLHALNAVLVYLVLRQMTGATWRSALVAGLFALHPQRVESVVWISELKDVLSTALALLTIAAYVSYARSPGIWRYLLVALAYLGGLLAKPMLVTLPCLLLLLDYWPLGRLRQDDGSGTASGAVLTAQSAVSSRTPDSCATQDTADCAVRTAPLAVPLSCPRSKWQWLLLEKAPLLAMALGCCVLTWYGQRKANVINSFGDMSLGRRLANVTVSYVRYIEKMVRLDQLGVFYPLPRTFPAWQVGGAAALLAAVTALAIWRWRRSPWLLVGWLWYVGMLVPVIGFVQINAQSMADRFSYLPVVGVLIMVVWSLPSSLWERHGARTRLVAAVAAILVTLCAYTWVQAGYWRDNAVLFEHTIDATRDNVVAEQDLGIVLMERGHLREAADHFGAAATINPSFVPALYNLGVTLAKLGDTGGAVKYLQRAAAIEPTNVDAHNNLGVLLAKTGRLDEAIDQYKRVLALQPGNALVNNNLANALVRRGDVATAIPYYRQAVSIDQGYAEAHENLGMALARLGQFDQAIAEFDTVLRLQPANTLAQQRRALVEDLKRQAAAPKPSQ